MHYKENKTNLSTYYVPFLIPLDLNVSVLRLQANLKGALVVGQAVFLQDFIRYAIPFVWSVSDVAQVFYTKCRSEETSSHEISKEGEEFCTRLHFFCNSIGVSDEVDHFYLLTNATFQKRCMHMK